MEWTWDEGKAASNVQKHGVPFEMARDALDDELSLALEDDHSDGDRWRTIGMVHGVLLFVIHTFAEDGSGGRIISARRATPAERRSYERK